MKSYQNNGLCCPLWYYCDKSSNKLSAIDAENYIVPIWMV